MTDESRKWLDAALILVKDATASVPCPICGEGTLTVKDEPLRGPNGMLDRYIICEQCGKWDVATVSAK